MTVGDERQLVQRIQAGEQKAFEEMMDAYETRVYRLALRFTGSIPDAEDVTLEIFHGVYPSVDSGGMPHSEHGSIASP